MPSLEILVHHRSGDSRQHNVVLFAHVHKPRVIKRRESLERLQVWRGQHSILEASERWALRNLYTSEPISKVAFGQNVTRTTDRIKVRVRFEAVPAIRNVERLPKRFVLIDNLDDALRSNIHRGHLHKPPGHIRGGTELNTSCKHQAVKVRSVPALAATSRTRIATHVARAENHDWQTTVGCSANELLGNPLALRIPALQLG
mmetsp:Transcript_17099/g.30165  ORF Transcript_17099/g.30165 Transcript_17099/m.30165 type:complete len:202 (+) Transcript_17099:839-1444(+)